MGMIETLFGSNPDLVSLILRLAVGSLFVIHGYPKLARKQREQGGTWMKSIGMPAGMMGFAGVVEFFGGLALLLGLLTPIVATLAALWMLSTTWFSISKLKKKYAGGYELDVTIVLIAIALALLGSGAFSIDHLLGL